VPVVLLTGTVGGRQRRCCLWRSEEVAPSPSPSLCLCLWLCVCGCGSVCVCALLFEGGGGLVFDRPGGASLPLCLSPLISVELPVGRRWWCFQASRLGPGNF
jgi:hypothetical protein